ncbi:type I secretion system permease/ATPase [Thalassobius sp. I31.1]|uniref:type I secretion system permease/ATPase n=1 Tax=Thalassobius sp. I31.1 TaxID=2109912 RepID=UPI000D1AAC1C|nr:type I secretion system permease/ATPase [Thalassobius sp. I31.1]
MQSPASLRRELRAARNASLSGIYIAFLFSIFVNLLMFAGPLFMMQIYDRVLGSRSEETLVALFLLIGFLYALMGILDFARGRVVARVGAKIQASLDARVFEGTLRMAIHPGMRSKPATALRDLETIQTFCASPVLLAALDLPWSPLFFAAIFIIHPTLGWLSLAGGGLLVLIAVINQFLTYKKVAQAQGASAEAAAFSEQARQATEIVRGQGMQEAISTRWQRKRIASLSQNLAASDWTGSFTSMTKALRMFLQSAMLAVGAWLVLQNEMSGGAMIASSTFLGRALAPIEQMVGQWAMLQRVRMAWSSLNKFLENVPLVPEISRLPKPEAHLSVQGLTLMPPGANKPTLRNLSFQLHPGEALGVIGKSASGKSTLARALLGLWSGSSGEVRLGGATLDQYHIEDLGLHIGYLPQQVTLLHGTIAENIARFSLEPDIEAVIAAAKFARAHELILSLPKGYDTVIGGNNSLLSGGQQQRIGLARALFGDPILLILDEPNSALDAEGSDALNQAVRDYKAQKKAVIIMTHRPTAIAECDTLMVIDQGSVAKIGPRDEVIKSMMKNPEGVTRNIAQAQA